MRTAGKKINSTEIQKVVKKALLIKAIKTATFKINNLLRRKRAMLAYALLHNHHAYIKALKDTQNLDIQSSFPSCFCPAAIRATLMSITI